MITEVFEYLVITENAVIIALISVFGSIMAARQRRSQKNTEAMALRRSRENLLSMRFMSANTDLSVVTALAVQNCEVNGQLDAALAAAKNAQKAYCDYIDELGAAAIAGVQNKKRGLYRHKILRER